MGGAELQHAFLYHHQQKVHSEFLYHVTATATIMMFAVHCFSFPIFWFLEKGSLLYNYVIIVEVQSKARLTSLMT